MTSETPDTRHTYAGQAKHLERAIVVAFHRMVEALGVERSVARHGVETADRFLQRLGVLYLAIAVVVLAWIVVQP
jgi:hypothetical protein